MRSADEFDVAIVGASIAGCTAARFFAQSGARVALIERRPDPLAYKVVCTHQILPSAAATIERLGLARLLEERGAVRTDAEFFSPYAGWFGFPDAEPKGWGVTRRTLDPLLRDLATGTTGVELYAARTAVALKHDDGRPAAVAVRNAAGDLELIRARLIVGADGRDSTVAKLAGVPGRVRAHNRFFYFAYWRGVEPSDNVARGWVLDPDAAAHFPNEDGLALLACGPHRSRLPEFQGDREGAYLRMLSSLPDAPDLGQAERVSTLIGKLEMPNIFRPASRPGLAFVGDAAVATDPLFGTGCGFAFQSAEWLVEQTAAALNSRKALDAALARYRRKILWRLGPHHQTIAEYSSGRRNTWWERKTFRAASQDPVVSLALGEVIARLRSPLRLLDPRVIARTLVPREAVPSTARSRSTIIGPHGGAYRSTVSGI